MTTPLPSLPLVEALLGVVTTAAASRYGVYLAGAPRDTDPPYAVMYPDTGQKSAFDRTLTNDGPNELRYQVTSVGAGPEQAAWVADSVALALLTNVPTVTGRRVWKTIADGVQPMRRDDESTGLFFVTAQYLTKSDPA